MDLGLCPPQRELADRAREFVNDVLLPFEDECEANDGLSERSLHTIRQAVIDWEFNAINHALEDGGQGRNLFDQVLISEQWGRATGALWDVPWRPAVPLRHARPEQRERYLRPACRTFDWRFSPMHPG
jgi:acyl-CoA dehydrogenase